MNEECNRDVLTLEHDTPEDFERCVCQTYDGLSLLYVAFQRLVEYYYFGMILFHLILVLQHIQLKLIIFFDYWTLWVMNIFPGLCLHWFDLNPSRYRTDWDYMPWMYKIYWAFFSAELPSSILSSIVFWTLVYSKKAHIFSIILNTVSPFLNICEFLLAAFPLRLLHFFFFIIYYAIYIIFTLIYQKCGGTGLHGSVYIYEVLDWRKPGKAILYAFIGLAIGEGIYVLFCFLSMFKLWLRDRYQY